MKFRTQMKKTERTRHRQLSVVAVIHSSSLLVEAVSSMREWKDETQEETNVTCSGRLNLKKDP